MQRTAYPTQSSATLYIVINLLASFAMGGVAYALQGQLKQWVGLVFIPLMFVPLICAYQLHKRDGGPGPFKGLVWGPTAWYWLLALGGLAWGALVVGAQLALGLAGFDPEMGYYVQQVVEMSAAQGNQIPDSALGTLSIGGWVTFGASLLFGPWIGAAFGSLGTFPSLGFLGRRLLVRGRVPALLLLMAYTAAGTAVAGLIDNPQLAETPLPARIGMYVFYGLAGLPAMFWVFLRTRSAVLPALLTASYSSALAAASPFLSDYAPWISNPQAGVASAAGSLLLGLALWVWQDPGSGAELATAAVAVDGTPLTPEQYEEAQAYAAQRSAGSAETGGSGA
jgi:hypothetical protein